jgi:hypothetical protein
MTHEVYLDLAFFDDPPEELGPGEERELPEQFQIWSIQQMAVSDRIV